MNKRWQALFPSRILQRGHDYFLEDHVVKFECEDDQIDAVVKGSQRYQVRIIMNQEEIEMMECDCPYAMNDQNCKHMAAVLYRWSSELGEDNVDWHSYDEYDDCDDEDEDEDDFDFDFDSGNDSLDEPYVTDEKSVHDLLRAVSKDNLISFLTKQAVSSTPLWNHLIARFRNDLTIDDQYAFRAEIQAIVSYYSSGYFSNRREAIHYKIDVMKFLKQKAESLIENEQYLHAIDLTYFVYTRAAKTHLDDSYGVTSEVMEACYQLWKTIWNLCTPASQERIKQYFEQELTGDYALYAKYHIRDFLMFECQVEAHLLVELERLDTQIETWKRGIESYRKTPMGDMPDVLARIYVMKLLGADEAKVAAYREKFWWHPVLRKEALDQAMQEANYQQAIAILNDGKLYDIDSPEEMAHHFVELIAIYEKLNDTDKLKNELLDYLLVYGQTDMKAYYKLKKLYEPENWIDIQKRIIEQQQDLVTLCAMLAEENRIDELYDVVLVMGNIKYIDFYLETLKPRYGKELLSLYDNYLDDYAQSAKHSDKYRLIASYLKKMRTLPGGDGVVEDLKNKWSLAYPTRSGMHSHLRNM